MDYSLLKDIKDKKFKIRIGTSNFKFTDKIKNDERYDELKKWFIQKYSKEGYGIKSLIKDFDLPITYSSLRNFLKFMEIDLHESNNANDFLKLRRKKNAQKQFFERSGMYSYLIQESLKIQNKTSRGIQGYYWNVFKRKYVWLRSSWEYIYAKWLIKNNIEWDVECNIYTFTDKNGKPYTYRPDFFIFENNVLKSIVEIKGYWKNKTYKIEKLKEHLTNTEIDVVLITDIKPYLQLKLKDEIKIWKQLRKSKLDVLTS